MKRLLFSSVVCLWATALREAPSGQLPGASSANFRRADQFASLQAAHDDLPNTGGTIYVSSNATPFGAAGTTGLVIAKSVHIVFDPGTFSYSGDGQAILCSSATGAVVEGAGKVGGGTNGGTIIAVRGKSANGLDFNVCPGAIIRNLNVFGPGSGTGRGLIFTGNSGAVEHVVVKLFGSDGCTINGVRGNSNSGVMLATRCVSNGGIGLNAFGENGNLWSFIETEVSSNGGFGAQIATAANFFGPLHSHDNQGRGTGVIFASGGSQNYGEIYSDHGTQATDLSFSAGANNNHIFLVSGITVSNSGTNNQWYGTGGYQNTLNTKSLRINAGAGGSVINLIASGSATLTFNPVAAQTCNEQTVMVPGATGGKAAFFSPAAPLGSTNLSWSSWVSAADTVSVRVCNLTAGPITPRSVTWNGWVQQ